MNSAVSRAFLSELSEFMDDARRFEMIRKEWAFHEGYIDGKWMTRGQSRAKRNRFRKSWPELADLLDKATKADVMDEVRGVVKE